MSQFKVGDKVRWQSQAQGSHKIKEGEVVAVLQPETRPSRHDFPDLYKTTLTGYAREPGYGRSEISYVVRVKSKHYWPRASALRPAERPRCPHCGGEL